MKPERFRHPFLSSILNSVVAMIAVRPFGSRDGGKK